MPKDLASPDVYRSASALSMSSALKRDPGCKTAAARHHALLDRVQVPASASVPLRIAVVVITSGRPDILLQVIPSLLAQTRRPDTLIVSAADPADVGQLAGSGDISVLFGPKGACAQRNTALLALSECSDVVVFFDDDFIAHPSWIERVEHIFCQRSCVDCVTGYLLADGVCRGGLSTQQGLALISSYAGTFEDMLQERYSPYGCNMAYRMTAIKAMRFDERLILYGWLEDRDFGASLSKRGGQLIKTGKAIGVHLGVSRGRVSGRRLGYSQIVNPFYLLGKDNISLKGLVWHIARNVGMNALRFARPEPYVDRRGRLVGNMRGLWDVSRGLVEPERAARL